MFFGDLAGCQFLTKSRLDAAGGVETTCAPSNGGGHDCFRRRITSRWFCTNRQGQSPASAPIGRAGVPLHFSRRHPTAVWRWGWRESTVRALASISSGVSASSWIRPVLPGRTRLPSIRNKRRQANRAAAHQTGNTAAARQQAPASLPAGAAESCCCSGKHGAVGASVIISKPPPCAPLMAATTGLPSFSSRRSWPLMVSPIWKMFRHVLAAPAPARSGRHRQKVDLRSQITLAMSVCLASRRLIVSPIASR